MATGATLVEDALQEAEVIGAGEIVVPEDQVLALRMLNRLLESWATDALMIYTTTKSTFTMTAGIASYSTSLLSARPISIYDVIVSSGGVDYHVDMIDEQTYNQIGFKSVAAIPSWCFNDTAFPNSSLKFYPVPSGNFTCTVSFNSVLTTPIASGTTVTFPPGYEKAIIDCLALELCKPFHKAPNPLLIQSAKEAKFLIKRNNYKPLIMSTSLDNVDISNQFIYKAF